MVECDKDGAARTSDGEQSSAGPTFDPSQPFTVMPDTAPMSGTASAPPRLDVPACGFFADRMGQLYLPMFPAPGWINTPLPAAELVALQGMHLQLGIQAAVEGRAESWWWHETRANALAMAAAQADPTLARSGILPPHHGTAGTG